MVWCLFGYVLRVVTDAAAGPEMVAGPALSKELRRQPDYPNDNQIDRDDVIEQGGLNQDENPGHQGNDRLDQD